MQTQAARRHRPSPPVRIGEIAGLADTRGYPPGPATNGNPVYAATTTTAVCPAHPPDGQRMYRHSIRNPLPEATQQYPKNRQVHRRSALVQTTQVLPDPLPARPFAG